MWLEEGEDQSLEIESVHQLLLKGSYGHEKPGKAI